MRDAWNFSSSFHRQEMDPSFSDMDTTPLECVSLLNTHWFSGSQISYYIWQRINISQSTFYLFPPILNLFQNLSTQIARNSHYFYSEPMLWSISYGSLYHIGVFISCQWFLSNPNVYIIGVRISSGLIFLNVTEVFNFFIFPWGLYLFIPFQNHIFWKVSTTSVKALPELLDKCDFWSSVELFFFWANLGSHQCFPWICYTADSQSACDLQVHPDPCHLICHKNHKFLLAPNNTFL